MSLEILIGKRTSTIDKVSQDKSMYTFLIDGREIYVDVIRISKGVYSILHDNRSYYIELIEGSSPKKFFVNTKNPSYELEIVDAESKYRRARGAGGLDVADNTIVSPMPGKVVRIPVKPGELVQPGQTVIIVSAMKMESEYKVSKEGTVKEILVKEGDTVDGNQKLIIIE